MRRRETTKELLAYWSGHYTIYESVTGEFACEMYCEPKHVDKAFRDWIKTKGDPGKTYTCFGIETKLRTTNRAKRRRKED